MTVFREISASDPNYRRSILALDSVANNGTALTLTGVKLTNAQPLHTAIVDGNGTQITSFGGGTQYAEGATTSPGTGTLAMGRYDATPPTLADGALYGLQLDENGNLKTTGSAGSLPGTLVSFLTDIPTAGTSVQLASHSLSQGVVVEAPTTNTGAIYVGDASVANNDYGAILSPGQSVGIAVNNTNLIYVDTATNGNDVAVLGS